MNKRQKSISLNHLKYFFFQIIFFFFVGVDVNQVREYALTPLHLGKNNIATEIMVLTLN